MGYRIHQLWEIDGDGGYQTNHNEYCERYIYIIHQRENYIIYIYIYIWVNYSDLTATSLEIMVNKGNHPQLALIQVSEIL